MSRFLYALTALALTTSLLSACSGGASSDGGIEGTGAPVAARGEISGFGSVFVNGVEYETNTADIVIDSVSGYSESALKVGMVVLIEGALDAGETTGDAHRVSFEQTLFGPVSEVNFVDGYNAEITVLGQTALIPDSAVFENLNFSSLAIGQVVAISGLTNATGVLATRIEKMADTYSDGDQVAVSAIIRSVDTPNRTFVIGDLSVDYSMADLQGFSSGQPEVGQYVRVNGRFFEDTGVIAAKVKLKTRGDMSASGVRLEYEGVITDFASQQSFYLSGQPVNAASAKFRRGQKQDLADGVRIEAEGTIDAGGVLQAQTITFKKANDMHIEASVDSVSETAKQVVVLGVAFSINELTAFDDRSEAHQPYFGLDDIRSGDRLSVRAASGTAPLTASRIERLRADDSVTVEGPVTAISGEVLSILGVAVDISDASGSQNGLKVGAFVEIVGDLTGVQSVKAQRIKVKKNNN
ncbi:conserved hypothetical protein [Hahella chejuensis KCTC 2396]|uniref:DUF5666 domain-containing protein n=1 Tax=Hahella chejuensis (strain KCTC 2396) TaxID=349521 RepID=Q2SEL8_HAHCH|nr:DUF5666 domain-containing protein [Hahella chejuensis]ABC30906.1 conserved hypothetical protein [Hahella chejuensis KCTC 2396]